MKIHEAFTKLRSSFEPLGTPRSSNFGCGLPDGVTLCGERMRYGCAFTAASACDVLVREDGPDAWGYQVRVPAGGAFRWNGGVWLRGDPEHSSYLWLEYAGSVLDVAYIHGGMPVWERYRAVSL